MAVAPCYTIVRGALGTNTDRGAPRCRITAASASSRRSAPMVKRVQVGDRVVVAGTSQCGQCYQCLQGRPDYCQFTFFSNAPGVEAFPPFAEMRDGTPRLRAGGHRRHERDHDGVRGVLRAGLQRSAGRASSRCSAISWPRASRPATPTCTSSRARTSSVFGAGPVGLGRRFRRAASRAPARSSRSIRSSTAASLRSRWAPRLALDPVAEGDGIVERVRELCRGTERSAIRRRRQLGPGRQRRHGARRGLRRRGRGVSGVSAEGRGAARSDQREDRPAGVGLHAHGRTRDVDGVHPAARARFPAPSLALLGRTIHPGQQGGLHVMRDIPRYVKLIETGIIDAKSVITRRYTLDREPPGDPGHRRSHDHHRRDRVHVIARRKPRVPDSRRRRR